jgi:hypothetical protein
MISLLRNTTTRSRFNTMLQDLPPDLPQRCSAHRTSDRAPTVHLFRPDQTTHGTSIAHTGEHWGASTRRGARPSRKATDQVPRLRLYEHDAATQNLSSSACHSHGHARTRRRAHVRSWTWKLLIRTTPNGGGYAIAKWGPRRQQQPP